VFCEKYHKDTEALLEASREVGLDVNTEKIKCMVINTYIYVYLQSKCQTIKYLILFHISLKVVIASTAEAVIRNKKYDSQDLGRKHKCHKEYNAEDLLEASREVGLDVNTEKTNHEIVFRVQNVGKIIIY
jgi:hypothetical protein